MDVTYNVDRQNTGGYYQSPPLEPEQSNPGLIPEPPTYYPTASNDSHHEQQQYDGYDHYQNQEEYDDEHQEPLHRQKHEHRHGHGLDIPYPPIEVRKPNPAYACMLQRVYAGHVSEFTSITQYFYHHVMLRGCYPDASEILHDVSIQEMHHLAMLAECIIKLGGDPVIGQPKHQRIYWWRGDMIDCSKQIRLMLLKDVQEEYALIDQYREIIRYIDDECVIALLERIILDEEEHIRLLRKLLIEFGCA